MPSTRDLRRRIKSVKNTAQITKAMQMVASSRMRRAQQLAIAGRPYARLMYRIQREVTTHAGDFSDPLLEVRDVRQRAVILISTDKGLCGALNSNLFREAAKFDARTTVFITAGRKAAQFVARTKRQLAAEFSYRDTPQFSEARAIVKFARDLFLRGEVDAVEVLFNRFINTISQKPTQMTLLPIGEIERPVLGKGVERETGDGDNASPGAEFLFEPTAAVVLGALLPHYLNFGMYQLLLESKASEQSARMVAMKNATDNAQQIIKDLTLDYNKIRQAGITNELLEISTAQMALG
jgi:F-type H+-transporting ATPase subunit gamma